MSTHQSLQLSTVFKCSFVGYLAFLRNSMCTFKSNMQVANDWVPPSCREMLQSSTIHLAVLWGCLPNTLASVAHGLICKPIRLYHSHTHAGGHTCPRTNLVLRPRILCSGNFVLGAAETQIAIFMEKIYAVESKDSLGKQLFTPFTYTFVNDLFKCLLRRGCRN